MKKVLIFIVLSFVSMSGVFADSVSVDTESEKISKVNTKIYKEVIFTRAYIRNNFSKGEEILTTLELVFNKLRKNKDIETLKKLKNKTGELLKVYKAKESLSAKQRKEYNLIQNIFYRTYIELIVFGEIDM